MFHQARSTDAVHDIVLEDLPLLANNWSQLEVAAAAKATSDSSRPIMNQAPRFWPRRRGRIRRLTPRASVIADVGLVGKLNAGKAPSKPRVALILKSPTILSLPRFPTSNVSIDMDRTLVVADIPTQPKGLTPAGLATNSCVERTRVLIHLIEPDPTDGTDPIENYAPSAASWNNMATACRNGPRS
jgi:GTP-binding protein